MSANLFRCASIVHYQIVQTLLYGILWPFGRRIWSTERQQRYLRYERWFNKNKPLPQGAVRLTGERS